MAAPSFNVGHSDSELEAGLSGKFRGRAIRALIIDDNPVNIRLLSQQLKFLGCNVDSSSSGVAGMELWELHDYSVIFIDCHMPNMDGKEVIRCIRDSVKYELIRPDIIAYSADVSAPTKSDYLRVGADYFVCKPMAIDGLCDVLVQCFDSATVDSKVVNSVVASSDSQPITNNKTKVSKLNREVAAFGVNKVSSDDQIVNIRYLDNILGTVLANDPQVKQTHRHLADMFLQQTAGFLSDMTAANEREDSSELGHIVHKFKSSARSVGADRVAAACVTLEDAIGKYDSKNVAGILVQIEQLVNEVKAYWLAD